MIELKDIGERLTSIVSVERYALGLLKMLETQTQKEIASYVGVSQSKLSHIVQLLSDIYSYKPCMIVRYVVDKEGNYRILLEHMKLDAYEFIDIFKFNINDYSKILDDIDAQLDMRTNTYRVDKLNQMTIDALHSLEYRYKA